VTLDRGDSQEKTASILRCIDYSHSNLSPEAQGLLVCLAPFTAVIFTELFSQYTEHLRQQPALAHLPFERWPEVLQEATSWGLLSPHPELPAYLHLQPIFPYFLRSRLQAPEHADVRRAVDTAFRQCYDAWSDQLYGLLNSRESQEKQVGQALVRLEYENLLTALHLALAAQVSIVNPYAALSNYLDATQDQQRGLELGETVLAHLQTYPTETLTGPIGVELVGVLDNIAKRQLLLKQYTAAEASYQAALRMLSQQAALEVETREKGKAGILHQLARVAQEQRQWAQARDYFLRALETYVAYEEQHYTLIVLSSLARLWQASGEADVPTAIAAILHTTAEDVTTLLRTLLDDEQ